MSANTRLFVGNLPDKVNENDLRTVFSTFGEITALDIKNKPDAESNNKTFAFVTISGSNYNIETCIKHFTNEDFNGSRLYVTRARESFLERLQRERELAQKKETEKNEPINTNFVPKPLNLNINSHKRKLDIDHTVKENGYEKKTKKKFDKYEIKNEPKIGDHFNSYTERYEGLNNVKDDKKQNSDKKRMESMKKKRQEFQEKRNIIKSGLIDIDKTPNKKVIFSDDDGETESKNIGEHKKSVEKRYKSNLFDGDESDNEVNFEIKKQFEGKKGQKVLDLQSRYKADKRFVLDERFIEDDKSDEGGEDPNENVELGQADEKSKQLNILQDVLGVPIKVIHNNETTKQTKPKLGMLRFDPTQPSHAKFLTPFATKEEQSKKSKKKKSKGTPEEDPVEEHPVIEIEKVEVSKDQFYKVSDTLKEAMAQPTSFSLRSLFAKDDIVEGTTEQVEEYTVLKPVKEKKVKNPLDKGEKNPFVYDSSESENEEDNTKEKDILPQIIPSEPKPIWREKLFFSQSDNRLREGLLFFTQSNEEKVEKERRELKSVMKKRIYNKERKDQMFKKKIGGRRKMVKKSFRKKH